MGYYINPSNETKESFLQREGIATNKPSWNDKPTETLPVCLIDNGFFKAAGIAYSEDEMNAFSNPSDYRPKLWFYVPVTSLEIFMK